MCKLSVLLPASFLEALSGSKKRSKWQSVEHGKEEEDSNRVAKKARSSTAEKAATEEVLKEEEGDTMSSKYRSVSCRASMPACPDPIAFPRLPSEEALFSHTSAGHFHGRPSSDIRSSLRAYERLLERQKAPLAAEEQRLKKLSQFLADRFDAQLSRDRLRFRALSAEKIIRMRPKPRYISISEEQEEVVTRLFSSAAVDGSAIVSKVEGIELSKNHLSCLRPLEWLNDEVINAYMVLLNLRSQSQCERELTHEEILLKGRPLRCYHWSTFFYTTLSGETANGNRVYSYDRVRRWTSRKKVDLFQYDLVFIPIHLHKVHWALGCIDLRSKLIFFFDSLGGEPEADFVENIKRYLNDEHQDKKGTPLEDLSHWLYAGNNFACSLLCPTRLEETEIWRWPHTPPACRDSTTTVPIPQQTNGSDCGVFTCLYAENLGLSRFPFDFSHTSIPAKRKIMANDLLASAITEGIIEGDEMGMERWRQHQSESKSTARDSSETSSRHSSASVGHSSLLSNVLGRHLLS